MLIYGHKIPFLMMNGIIYECTVIIMYIVSILYTVIYYYIYAYIYILALMCENSAQHEPLRALLEAWMATPSMMTCPALHASRAASAARGSEKPRREQPTLISGPDESRAVPSRRYLLIDRTHACICKRQTQYDSVYYRTVPLRLARFPM